MDLEILNLLAGHAASVIVGSQLHADAERKLQTIEGFTELIMRGDSPSEATIPDRSGS